jgi:hypothetical protein
MWTSQEAESLTLNIYCTERFITICRLTVLQPFCHLATDYPSWALDNEAVDENGIRMVHISESGLYAVEAKILPRAGKLVYRTLGSLPKTSSGWAESSWAVEHGGDARGERLNVAFGLSNAPPVVLSYPMCEAGEWVEIEVGK